MRVSGAVACLDCHFARLSAGYLYNAYTSFSLLFLETIAQTSAGALSSFKGPRLSVPTVMHNTISTVIHVQAGLSGHQVVVEVLSRHRNRNRIHLTIRKLTQEA